MCSISVARTDSAKSPPYRIPLASRASPLRSCPVARALLTCSFAIRMSDTSPFIPCVLGYWSFTLSDTDCWRALRRYGLKTWLLLQGVERTAASFPSPVKWTSHRENASGYLWPAMLAVKERANATPSIPSVVAVWPETRIASRQVPRNLVWR